jgi:hypothetical protein
VFEFLSGTYWLPLAIGAFAGMVWGLRVGQSQRAQLRDLLRDGSNEMQRALIVHQLRDAEAERLRADAEQWRCIAMIAVGVKEQQGNDSPKGDG